MLVYVLLRYDEDGKFVNFDVFTNKERAKKAHEVAVKQWARVILKSRITADKFYDF